MFLYSSFPQIERPLPRLTLPPLDSDDEHGREPSSVFDKLATDFYKEMMIHLHSHQAAAAWSFFMEHCEDMSFCKENQWAKSYKAVRGVVERTLPSRYISCKYQNRTSKECKTETAKTSIPRKKYPASRYRCLYQAATCKV